MRTLAERAYLDSGFDTVVELPRAGSALENPYVYDAVARDLGDRRLEGGMLGNLGGLHLSIGRQS